MKEKSSLYDDSERRSQVITYDLRTNIKEKAVIPVDKPIFYAKKEIRNMISIIKWN